MYLPFVIQWYLAVVYIYIYIYIYISFIIHTFCGGYVADKWSNFLFIYKENYIFHFFAFPLLFIYFFSFCSLYTYCILYYITFYIINLIRLIINKTSKK